MQNKLFEKVFSIGLLLIIISFNPFIFPGLYIDSTVSFSFIALIKIFLLAVLDFIVLVLWILKIRKSGEFSVSPSKIYIPVFLFIISVIISTIFSSNKNISLFGYNSTLENSLFEAILLFFFFLAFVNNINLKESVENIIRFINYGVVIAILYTILRFSFKGNIDLEPFKYYFESPSFSIIGHYNSLLPVSLAVAVFSTALIITNLVLKRDKFKLILDYISLSISMFGLGILLNLDSQSPEYLYLFLSIVVGGAFFYFISINNRLQKTLVPVLSIFIISFLLGIGMHFLITKNNNQPQFYPSIPMDITWGVTLDSIETIDKGLLGNGPSSFANSFDLYKKDEVALPYQVNDQVVSNFTTNSQSPNTEELRIFQSPSYLLNILLSYGLFGLISFILIAGTASVMAFGRSDIKSNILGFFSFFVFIGLILISIIIRQDFIISLFIWLSLGVFIISANEDEPQRNFIIAFTGKSLNLNDNWNSLIPSFFAIISLIIIAYSFPILGSNYYLYLAKQAQINNKRDLFISNVTTATNIFSLSDLTLREKIFAKSLPLFEKYENIKSLSKETSTDSQSKIITETNQIINLQNELAGDLNKAIALNPKDYKNYYLGGLLLGTASEFTSKLNFDKDASGYLEASRIRNPHHPDTYYQLAKIYYRNGQYTAALNTITPAINLRPQNLLYAELYADIFKDSGNFQNALNIYNRIKEIKEQNSSNQFLQDFYQRQNIEKDIEETNKKLKEQQSAPTPSASPTPAINTN